jgi:hypothetical protein
MTGRYYRCNLGQTECGAGTSSDCKHRIPHIYMEGYCDRACEYGGKCIPGSFRLNDRYMILGRVWTIIKINQEKNKVILLREGEGTMVLSKELLLDILEKGDKTYV